MCLHSRSLNSLNLGSPLRVSYFSIISQNPAEMNLKDSLDASVLMIYIVLTGQFSKGPDNGTTK